MSPPISCLACPCTRHFEPAALTLSCAIKVLTVDNISYTSDTGKSYNFNTADKLNTLLLNALLTSEELESGKEYDFDFDHQYIETEKYDAMPTYKKFLGYGPGVGVIGDMIVGIENRDGNINVRFHQQDTLERMFTRLESAEIRINRAKMDCDSCSESIVEMIERRCNHFYAVRYTMIFKLLRHKKRNLDLGQS